MKLPSLAILSLLITNLLGQSKETLPPLQNGQAPQTLEALWADFDPRAEALEVEVLTEWEEDQVLMKVLRYRIGIFKGQKAMMAAIYGHPKGERALPGLVQIHGGGQYADYRAVLTNAKRGYATISIAWAGRINAPDYKVTPREVQLFWDDARNDPNYKVTTDWGALDAYHAPCRNPKNAFAHVSPAAWTLDTVASPRNNPWFLCTLGARRAITFLEAQPEVDAEKLGVYGHSMGGKLTVMTAATDHRLKAAAPSCGGVSNSPTEDPLYAATIADRAHLSEIQCPTLFLKPANDFHGHLSDVPEATRLIKNKDWRTVTSAHHNHQDHGEFEVSGLLWFDQHLRGSFTFPKTPVSALHLGTSELPTFTVTPDTSKPILQVDVYYTQQGDRSSDRDQRINRYWHHAKASKNGDTWTATLPIFTTDQPLWAYANVRYQLDKAITGAGYYYRVYTTETFNNSTLIQIATAEQLKGAQVKATLKPSQTIETFEADWEKSWFSYRPEEWPRRTHKIYTPLWAAPKTEKVTLALEVRSEKANRLVVGLDAFAAEVSLKGGSEWQSVELKLASFLDASSIALEDWNDLVELRLGAKETLRAKNRNSEEKRLVGANWKGAPPSFRNLRWIAERK